jgi:hypothetical protein
MKTTIALAFASALTGATVGCAQSRYYAPPPPPYAQTPAVRRDFRGEIRFFDRGYSEGYRAGLEHRGGSGAPDFLTANMYREDRREFRRGYHDGFERGKYDRKHGAVQRRY